MRTDICKLSLALLVVSALMTGCSQDDAIADVSQMPSDNELLIFSHVKEFIPDAATRMTDTGTENGYTTTFDIDDEIGVYVIDAEGNVLVNNMPMKYAATVAGGEAEEETTYQWTPSNEGQKLAFYEDAKYIAYSPYMQEMTGVADEAAIVEYFSEQVLTAVGKTYKECDLMTATHQTSEWDGMNTQTITFNFAHVLSMVEFVIPTTVTYTSVDGNYTYKGLGVQIAALQQKEGETEYVSVIADGSSFDDLKVKDCVYRKLYVPQTPTEGSVSAATYLFKGKLTKPNGTSAFFKTEQEFTPVAGVYKKVTVNVEGVSAPEGGRDIKVGDYVYVDGSIFPGTNDDNTPRTDIPEKDCIGIVYKVDVTTNASKVAVNAMALKQSFKKIFTKPETPEEVEAALEWSQIEGYKNQLVFVESALSNADALNHRATDDIINIFNQKTDLRLYTGLQDYKKTYPLTLSYDNTDWFIPALGDLNDAFSALDDNATESIALNAQDEYTCQRIDKVIEKVNLNGKEGVNNFTSMNKWLWTISESNETNAYAYRTPDAANNGTECIGRSKTAWKFGQRNALFCPFLRFYLPISTPAVD